MDSTTAVTFFVHLLFAENDGKIQFNPQPIRITPKRIIAIPTKKNGFDFFFSLIFIGG